MGSSSTQTITGPLAIGSVLTSFFTIAWQEAAVFIVMILVLFVRPEGLFKRGGMRVG